MGCHANRVVSTVESDELGFEHDITVNLEIGSGSLETSETGCERVMLAC